MASPHTAENKAQSIQMEVQVTVNGVDYLLIPNGINFLSLEDDGGVAPVLVYVTSHGQKICSSILKEFEETVLNQDDVFQPEFFRNVLFYGHSKADLQVDPDIESHLKLHWGTVWHDFVVGDINANVRRGPYIFMQGTTWQPWRIYRDTYGAFMSTLKPAPDFSGRLVTLDTPQAGLGGRVVVPSRCYFEPSPDRPLDGARISVKDNIDIAGHKTTLCNRAWEELYPARSEHAACVQAMIDAGAVIVGKVKLQAMIMREEPLEAVEFTAPFNPRGDGYQVPSGSSHGSAVSIGAYDWLDFSFGSDTNGSGRKPAQYNGCFSIRPSTGIMDTTGVVGQFPLFDMPVFFGRDLGRFPEFISAWYGKSPDLRPLSDFSVRILYPQDYLPTTNPAQTRLIDNFVKGLEEAFDVTKKSISLATLWKEECPAGEANADLAEYLRLTGGYPYYYDSYKDLERFRVEYEEKYGKPPFIHRAMQWQWDVSRKISRRERDMYWERSETYRKWLLSRVFNAKNHREVTVMVFPIETGRPNYRDSELPPMGILSGYASLNMSPMMRAPELTAIVGESNYVSDVTKREEPFPIAASVIGAPGTDLILAEIVRKGMEAADIPTTVKTGRFVH